MRQIHICTFPRDRTRIHPCFNVLLYPPLDRYRRVCCNLHESILWIYHPWTVQAQSLCFWGRSLNHGVLPPGTLSQKSPKTTQKKPSKSFLINKIIMFVSYVSPPLRWCQYSSQENFEGNFCSTREKNPSEKNQQNRAGFDFWRPPLAELPSDEEGEGSW